MAQIKIEITYDPSTETLEQAVSSLVPRAIASAAVTAPATTDKPKPESTPKAEDKPASPTSASTDETSAPAETEGPAATETASDQPSASPSDPPPRKVSKTDVRAAATALSKAGKREQLSAIFAEFGGKKLSDIKEEDYPALMEKLEAANG